MAGILKKGREFIVVITIIHITRLILQPASGGFCYPLSLLLLFLLLLLLLQRMNCNLFAKFLSMSTFCLYVFSEIMEPRSTNIGDRGSRVVKVLCYK